MADIFLSYSSADRPAAGELVEHLVEQGYSVWWDTQGLRANDNFVQSIDNELNAARVVLCLFSQTYVRSNYCLAEALRGADQSKAVFTHTADFAPSLRALPVPFNTYHFCPVDERARLTAAIGSILAGGRAGASRASALEIYERSFDQPVISANSAVLPDDWRKITPAHLLQARFQLTPFVDSGAMATELTEWACDDSAHQTGRIIHGAGGLGKTRLLIEVCNRLRSRAWCAGFLADRPTTAGASQLAARANALRELISGRGADHQYEGVFLVIDYAEARQEEISILARWASEDTSHRRPFRLVLLSRSVGEWWRDKLQEESVRYLFEKGGGIPDATEISPLSSVQERLSHFNASLQTFSGPVALILKARGETPPTFPEPSDTLLNEISTSPEFERPLAVHLRALLHLWGTHAGPTHTTAELLELYLAVERSHWGKVIPLLDRDRVRKDALNRGIAQVTSVSRVPDRQDCIDLLRRDEYFGKRSYADVATPIADLEVFYSEEAEIVGLQPDLIGEHQVLSVSDDLFFQSIQSWIEAGAEGQKFGRRVRYLTVLRRATRSEHGAKAELAKRAILNCINRDPKNYADAFVEVLVATAGSADIWAAENREDLSEDARKSVDRAIRNAHENARRLAASEPPREARNERTQSEGKAATPRELPIYYSMVAAYFFFFGIQFVVFPTALLGVLDASATHLGLAQLALTAPMALLLFAGSGLAQVAPRRATLVILYTLAAIPLLGLFYSISNGTAAFGTLVGYGIAMGAISALLMPARDAALNGIVMREQQRGGSVTVAQAAASTTAIQIGAQIGGILVGRFEQSWGIPTLLLVQVASLTIAAICATQLHERRADQTRWREVFQSALGDLWDGLRYGAGDRVLLPLLIAGFATGLLVISAMSVTFPLVAFQVFERGSAGLSVLIAVFWGASFVAAVILSRRAPMKRPGRTLLGAQILGGLIALALAFQENFQAFVALAAGWGAMAGIAISASRTVVQSRASKQYLGRLLAAYSLTFMAGAPLGVWASGLLADEIGVRATLLVSGAGLLFVFVALWFASSLRVGSTESGRFLDPRYE